MKIICATTAALALLSLSIALQADVFDLGAGLTNLETVTVDDARNTPDTTGYGSVGYEYNIGKYEVTAKQYTEFLNAKAKRDDYGLYSTSMWSSSNGCHIQRTDNNGSFVYSVADDWANRPVNYVSFWDACRFANWLGNGQGDGDTETGAYTISSYNGKDGRTITRNNGWEWAVTSENEWYKAAYYKGGNTNAGYWTYPTSHNTAPGKDITDASGNNANINQYGYTIGSPYYRTNVGEFQNSESPYSTFDQGGNVCEWNESIVYEAQRGLRGASYMDGLNGNNLQASFRGYYSAPNYEDACFGFRVVQAVPEPSSIAALAGGLMALLGIKRRRA